MICTAAMNSAPMRIEAGEADHDDDEGERAVNRMALKTRLNAPRTASPARTRK